MGPDIGISDGSKIQCLGNWIDHWLSSDYNGIAGSQVDICIQMSVVLLSKDNLPSGSDFKPHSPKMCYFSNWSTWTLGNPKIDPERSVKDDLVKKVYVHQKAA